MSTSPQEGKLIYHLTSLDNLENILKNGLTSRSELSKFDDVAEIEIINHRNEKGLNSYVPFHFFAGNPFDGAVQKAYPNKIFVFLTLQRTFAQKNGFKILKQHPLSLLDCTPMSYSNGFDEIDWDTMSLRDYSDHNCREICMAECLSPIKIDPTYFFNIYTPSNKIKDIVEQLRNSIVGKGAFFVDTNSALFLK